MHSGFYTERDMLVQDYKDEIEDIDFRFEFMDGLDFFYQDELSCIDMYKYLHGYCYLFALMLSKVFGYKIKSFWTSKDNLIHAFCVTQSKDGKEYYIDARGYTDDYDEFISEFPISRYNDINTSSDFIVVDSDNAQAFSTLITDNTPDWMDIDKKLQKELDLLSKDVVLQSEYKI